MVFCITFIIIFICQGCAVVGEAKGQNKQGQTNDNVTVTQSPIPSIQPVTEQPKATEIGQRANDKAEITINDTRSSVLEWAAIVLNFLLLLVVGYQAYTYKKQLQVMREERGVISEQAGTLKEQAEAMKGQLKVMQDQTTALQDSLTETRKMVAQNERVVEASETQATASKESTELAREVFYVGESAYFGIKDVLVGDFIAGRKPTIRITFVNGGKTPAWHFLADVGVSIGSWPDVINMWSFNYQPNIFNSFIPAGEERTFICDKTDLTITEEQHKAITDVTERLFVFGSAHYSDFRGKPQRYDYCAVYIPATRKCYDFKVP